MNPNPFYGELKIVDHVHRAMLEESDGAAITFEHLAQRLVEAGESQPERLIEDVSPKYLVVDHPFRPASRARATPYAIWSLDSTASEINQGFVPALRGCFDAYTTGPASIGPTVIDARQLLAGRALTAAQVRIIGHLLDVDKIGQVKWEKHPARGWSIQLDLQILRFGSVGFFPDYLNIVLAE